jgi:hypothetical protein
MVNTRSAFSATVSLWDATTTAHPFGRGKAQLGKDQPFTVVVKIAGRLVGEDQVRFRDQRASHGDALLLPSRQLGWAMIDPVAQSRAPKDLAGH